MSMPVKKKYISLFIVPILALGQNGCPPANSDPGMDNDIQGSWLFGDPDVSQKRITLEDDTFRETILYRMAYENPFALVDCVK